MKSRQAGLTLLLRVTIVAALVSATASLPAQVQLHPPVRTPQGLRLEWTDPGPGSVHTVQTRDRLTGGIWLLPEAPENWPIAQTRWTDPNPSAPARFYRVLTLPAVQRGHLLNAEYRTNLTTVQIAILLALAGVNLTPQYAVQVYKLTYETIGPWGEPTRATAALVLPVGPGPWPLLGYQHGTILRTNDAPSAASITGELGIGVVFASQGYVTVLPDYLGLGDSPGLHPYHHARSEATAGVDALRAARAWCTQLGVALNDRLFLAGYSQGGHATMALHREIEQFHLQEFNLTASAPMAGAYDLSETTANDFLSGRPQPNPYYFAYLLAAYQEVYRLTNSLADLLAPPYDTLLPPLFHGHVGGGSINAVMPNNPLLILKPEILQAFRTEPDHPLRLALRQNDVHRWRPTRPMRLYHCSGDQDVVFANALAALSHFHQQGATQVELVEPLPGGNHATCVYPSLLQALQWFETLRR
ncbi:hypothetical protein G4L39_07870 [Limisphaera ngatamarikiensis]|uniref:Prolyl oligopeptidase family serine peptidase n=1 Tax=Limisphaera ngatamarikiensis TaxID=1324935 RepID=A0A6M1RRR1_9BACT|nr:lipase family protein [Limisphaera ngatamarikiensis]NGO39315.1 hypothetical protein [Limisphaera ngatamarikiensis]